MLAELVEVVIGVDTHADTHTAAVVDARTGGVLARATVSTDPDGYNELITLAGPHPGLPSPVPSAPRLARGCGCVSPDSRRGQPFAKSGVSGATLCGLSVTPGSLEAGKAADLLAVDGNLDRDISALALILLVVKDGQQVAGRRAGRLPTPALVLTVAAWIR